MDLFYFCIFMFCIFVLLTERVKPEVAHEEIKLHNKITDIKMYLKSIKGTNEYPATGTQQCTTQKK